jgi:hypothetical protein
LDLFPKASKPNPLPATYLLDPSLYPRQKFHHIVMPKRKSTDLLNEFGFKKPKTDSQVAGVMDLDCRGGDEAADNRRHNLVLDPTINEKLHCDLWNRLIQRIAEQRRL